MSSITDENSRIERLVRLETKLDQVLFMQENAAEKIEVNSHKLDTNYGLLADRLNALETFKSYVMGGVGVLGVLGGVLIWAGTRYAETIAQDAVNNISYVEETCKEIRREYAYTVDTKPRMCDLDNK